MQNERQNVLSLKSSLLVCQQKNFLKWIRIICVIKIKKFRWRWRK